MNPSVTLYFGESTAGSSPATVNLSPVSVSAAPWAAPGDHHSQSVNVLYFDAHVKLTPRSRLVLRGDGVTAIGLGGGPNRGNSSVKWSLD